MNIQESLKTAITQAVQELYNQPAGDVLLQPTKAAFGGLYTFVTFPLTKPLRLSPPQIGQAIGNWLTANAPELVSGFNVVQGFLNISIADPVFLAVLNEITSQADVGQLPPKNESVMVEYSSPNTNKPLHLGHLRNNFLGESVARILTASGYDVTRASIVNDRGIHICKSMIAYQRFGQTADGQWETPESSGLKGDHLIGKYYVLFDKAYKAEIEQLVADGIEKEKAEKQAPLMGEAQAMLRRWEAGDPETIALWNKLNTWVYAGFAVTYQNIGTHFDKTYYESQTYILGKEVVEDGLASGVFYRKADGSVWIDLTDEGLDQKLVLRADGTSVYITQDLGTTDLKFSDFHNNRSIWVVGNEQDYHFQVLFAILRRLGRPYANGCYHLSYGMVDLPTGKMKSREGTVVDADDLVADVTEAATQAAREAAKGKLDEMPADERATLFPMLGLGALKYYLLKVEPKKRMLFNPEESVDLQGHTGPYIQYTHARIKSVLRKNGDEKDERRKTKDVVEGVQLHPTEQQLIFLLSQYSQRVAEAGADYAPSYIAQFAYELAKIFNQFYDQLAILKETDEIKKQLRLQLSAQVAETIRHAMGLLGIEVPEKM